jgi:CheY-like chemotaxis protein
MMPKGDGIQLTQKIRSTPLFQNLPILILSSAGEQGLVKRFDEAGANACLAKPVTRQRLFDVLTEILSATSQGKKQNIITTDARDPAQSRRLIARDRPFYGMQILLVEDNRVNLEITNEMLTQFGCQVTMAENGKQAIECARTHIYDLIFMDCQMPEMDGFEAARHIVSLKAGGHIAPVPIVAFTANALRGDRERCLESGMDDYLMKPVRKTNLEAILFKWLNPKIDQRAAAKIENKKTEEREAARKSTVKQSSSAIYFDPSAFADAQTALGSKFHIVLSYYVEDAQSYIDRIAEAIQKNDLKAVIAPAHTLKSSSRQLGAIALADLAARAELAARSNSSDDVIEDMPALLASMRNAYDRVRFILNSYNTA